MKKRRETLHKRLQLIRVEMAAIIGDHSILQPIRYCAVEIEHACYEMQKVLNKRTGEVDRA